MSQTLCDLKSVTESLLLNYQCKTSGASEVGSIWTSWSLYIRLWITFLHQEGGKTHQRKYISTWQIRHSYNICTALAFLLESCISISAIVNLIFWIFYTFCILCISLSVIVNHRSREAAQYTHPSRADKCPKWLINSWIQIDCLTFPFANRDLKKKSNRFLDILLVTAEAGQPHISREKVIDEYSMNHISITFVEYYSIQIHHLTFKFFQLSASEMKVIHCWWPQ